jgi:urease accessory protein
MTTWLLLQLVDGAFPSGGFAHSAALEPSLHLRGIGELEPFVDEALWQTGRSALPFVRRALEKPAELASHDALFDASSTSHVANRASRAQGRSFTGAACRVFERPDVLAIGEHARLGPAHHAVMFGAILGVLGMNVRDTQMAWLHGSLRGMLSAAVRLGIVGPLEAQQIQTSRTAVLDAVIATCGELEVAEAAMTAPLLELFGALHDRLDGRLFQS